MEITDERGATGGSGESEGDALGGPQRDRVANEPVQSSNTASGRSRAEATFSFTVEDISNLMLGERAQSPICYVRNLPWRIVITPLLLLSQPGKITRTLGFYLLCNEDSECTSWWCHAIAQLRLLSHFRGGEMLTRTIQHRYCFAENDYGLQDFITWQDMFDPDKGYVSNNSITVQVYLVAGVPYGLGWDNKIRTGHVGLQNQGAKCYMNSLLQTLFFTNQLRRAVYNIPMETEGRLMVSALRRVFLGLQFSEKSVDTKTLTDSLGWTALDSFMQQDVHEFLRTLLDRLQSDMRGTSVEGTVPNLFEGAMVTTIRCTNVDYTSTRRETFQDIQLSVAGKCNIYESFQEYVEWESLAGSNRYAAGEHGLQEAEKRVTFELLPPVLHLHLKRFQYDPVTDRSTKLNDRFEFYEHISLGEYLQEAAPADYTLHAVLVHSGWNQSGHYVAFIDTRLNGNWCKFDDEMVSHCTKRAAIECNYGGQEFEMIWDTQYNTNAYMLVYIRDTDIPSVLREVTESDIPRRFTEELAEKKRIAVQRRKELAQAKHYMMVNVVVEDAFDGHQGYDLYDPKHASPRVFRVLKDVTHSDLMELFRKAFGYSLERMRLWRFVDRTNGTRRPGILDMESEQGKHVMKVVCSQNSWSLFLELQAPDAELNALPEFDNDEDVLLFFKLYDPILKRIHYCGHAYLSLESKLGDVVPMLNDRAGFPPGTELLFYEEVRPNTIEKIDNLDESLDLVLKDIMDGDIIVFQKAEQTEVSDLPTCIDYFRDLLRREEFRFVDYSIQNDSGFTLELSLRMTFEQLKYKVAQCSGGKPDLLQFFAFGKNNTLGTPVQCRPEDMVEDLLVELKAKTLFYLKMPTCNNEVELTQQFKCFWLGPDLKKEMKLNLHPDQWGTIAELLEEARSQVELSPEDGSGQLRIVQISQNKLKPGPKRDEPLTVLKSNGVVYRIEEIPLDQFNLQEDEMLVPSAHFNNQVRFTFGVPFYLRAKHGEPFQSLMDRMQKRLAVPDEEWRTYKFAVVLAAKPWYIAPDTYIVNLQDFRPHVSRFGCQLPWLGLDHACIKPRSENGKNCW